MKAVNVDDVLKILHKYGRYIFVTDEKRYSSMVDEIANLKALEQEPFMNKPCVAHQICHEDKVKVLEKIRAEIKQMDFDFGDYYDRTDTIREMVLTVIDKYKAESEVKG